MPVMSFLNMHDELSFSQDILWPSPYAHQQKWQEESLKPAI